MVFSGVNSLSKDEAHIIDQSLYLYSLVESFEMDEDPPEIQKLSKTDFLYDVVVLGWHLAKGWAVINKKNSFNVKHNHQNCYLSSAYYIKKPENSGDITFHDPKEAKTYRFPEVKKHTNYSAESITIKPEEGDLLIFPSYLYHDVGTNLSDEERVVVSFTDELLQELHSQLQRHLVRVPTRTSKSQAKPTDLAHA
mgnify:CR=1 FL=1